MGKFKLKRALGENGLSLVEVLASFVILTLLLTTFLMMFIQSAKVNKASEHVIDATYLAQTEMENVYAVSTAKKYSERKSAILGLGYEEKVSEDSWMVFEKAAEPAGGLIRVRLLDKNVKMTRLIVEVYEGPEKILRAKMENILVWRTE